MKFLPDGQRQWLGFLLRLSLAAILLFLAARFMIGMSGTSYRGQLQPLSDGESIIRGSVRTHVSILAGHIGERNLEHYAALGASYGYIKSAFEALGYGARTQEYVTRDRPVKNIEVEIAGSGLAGDVIVVGAHYDSALGSPGANDNATGVAAILELARLLRNERLRRTLRLVAFVNEEPPYFQTDEMGSRVYSKRASELRTNIRAMISVETIGYSSDEPGSQLYPLGFSLFYPSKGNFIAFVGNLSSRGLARRAVAAFRETTLFPSEGVVAPGWFTGVGWSDHWSFWQEQYPAIMITDTALFRYPQYHSGADTPERIDYDRTARVVSGLARVVVHLANA